MKFKFQYLKDIRSSLGQINYFKLVRVLPLNKQSLKLNGNWKKSSTQYLPYQFTQKNSVKLIYLSINIKSMYRYILYLSHQFTRQHQFIQYTFFILFLNNIYKLKRIFIKYLDPTAIIHRN